MHPKGVIGDGARKDSVPGIAAASMLGALMFSPAFADPTTAPARRAWAERVQILYQADTRSVLRRTVRVWDSHPEKNLDFVLGAGRGPVARTGRSPRTAPSTARAGWSGGFAARRAMTRKPSIPAILAISATAGPTGKAGSSCARARCSTAIGWPENSTARASISMPTATVMKGQFVAGIPSGEGRSAFEDRRDLCRLYLSTG